MSAGVAFSVMLTQLQRRANIDNQAGPITLPEQRDYLNEGLTEFQDLLVAARGQEHCRKSQSFSTIAAQSLYPLGADFYEMISGDIQVAPNQFVSLEVYMEPERNMFRLYPAWSGSYLSGPWYYRIQGSIGDQNVVTVAEKQINFIPTPQSAYPVSINYVWRYPTFDQAGSQDSNLVNGVNGWEAYAVWHAVISCKNRLREDASFAMMRLAALKERIQELAPQNDAGKADRIRDVEVDYDSSTRWW